MVKQVARKFTKALGFFLLVIIAISFSTIGFGEVQTNTAPITIPDTTPIESNTDKSAPTGTSVIPYPTRIVLETEESSISSVVAIVLAAAGLITAIVGVGSVRSSNKSIRVSTENIEKQLDLEREKHLQDARDFHTDRVASFAREKRVEWLNNLKEKTAEYLETATDFQTLDADVFKEKNLHSLLHLNSRKIRLHLYTNHLSDFFILREMFMINRYIDIILLTDYPKEHIKRVETDGEKTKTADETLFDVLVYYKMLFSGLTQRGQLKKNANMFGNYINLHGYVTKLDSISEMIGSDIGSSKMTEVKERIEHSFINLFGLLRRHKELLQIFTEIYINTEWKIIEMEAEGVDVQEARDSFDDIFFELMMDRQEEVNTLSAELMKLE